MPNDEPPHLIGIGEGYYHEARRRGAQEPRRALSGAAREEPGLRRARNLFACWHRLQYRLVKSPPESWADLWNPRAQGEGRDRTHLVQSRPRDARHRGQDLRRLGRQSRARLDRLKMLEAKAARSPATLTQMLEREEIAIAPLWNNNTAAAAEQGPADPPSSCRNRGHSRSSRTSRASPASRHPDLVNEWLERHPQPRIPDAGPPRRRSISGRRCAT